jgi:hypothetical protein
MVAVIVPIVAFGLQPSTHKSNELPSVRVRTWEVSSRRGCVTTNHVPPLALR